MDSHTALIVDVGDVLGHGYKVGANRSYDAPRIMHTMSHVRTGDKLKLYDSGPAKAFLGSIVVEHAKQLGSETPMPSGWSNTQWVNRVHPDSLALWQVTFSSCQPPQAVDMQLSVESAATTTNSSSIATFDACGAGTELSTLVQIDRFGSFGTVVRNCSLHDSCESILPEVVVYQPCHQTIKVPLDDYAQMLRRFR